MAFETLNERTKQLISEIAESLAYQVKPNNNIAVKEAVKSLGGKIVKNLCASILLNFNLKNKKQVSCHVTFSDMRPVKESLFL